MLWSSSMYKIGNVHVCVWPLPYLVSREREFRVSRAQHSGVHVFLALANDGKIVMEIKRGYVYFALI